MEKGNEAGEKNTTRNVSIGNRPYHQPNPTLQYGQRGIPVRGLVAPLLVAVQLEVLEMPRKLLTQELGARHKGVQRRKEALDVVVEVLP